jgi:hypothetical protein
MAAWHVCGYHLPDVRIRTDDTGQVRQNRTLPTASHELTSVTVAQKRSRVFGERRIDRHAASQLEPGGRR